MKSEKTLKFSIFIDRLYQRVNILYVPIKSIPGLQSLNPSLYRSVVIILLEINLHKKQLSAEFNECVFWERFSEGGKKQIIESLQATGEVNEGNNLDVSVIRGMV